MVAYILIPGMAIAGYAAAPFWVVLFGVAGIASEGWWIKLRQFYLRPRPSWSAKITTYFVTGILANIGLSALAYGAGRLARALTS